MTNKQKSISAFFIGLSALVGYEVGLADVADFAHDELTIIRKNLDKSCYYYVHENTLLALCAKKSLINQ
ncbi:hypothetical protein IGV50_004421 [Salmonella enterica subsp. enterica serovar Newport]|nr:hypothetical protein [Salmonella enterica subsp. enterica serovar Newport]